MGHPASPYIYTRRLNKAYMEDYLTGHLELLVVPTAEKVWFMVLVRIGLPTQGLANLFTIGDISRNLFSHISNDHVFSCVELSRFLVVVAGFP